MLISHIPTGYLITRLIVRFFKRFNSPGAFHFYLFSGVIAAILPDLDLAYYYLLDPSPSTHHEYWTHLPPFWIFLFASVSPFFICGRFRVKWLARSISGPLLFFIVSINILVHLAMDSMVGNIKWFYPLSDWNYAVFEPDANYIYLKACIILHPSFLVELSIFTLFMLRISIDLSRRDGLFLRKRFYMFWFAALALLYSMLYKANDIAVILQDEAPTRSVFVRTRYNKNVYGIKSAKRMPSSTENLKAYSIISTALGRNSVSSELLAIVTEAHRIMKERGNRRVYRYGEGSWPFGGPLWPHKKPRFGETIDFILPRENTGWRIDFLTGAGDVDTEGIRLQLSAISEVARGRGAKIRQISCPPGLDGFFAPIIPDGCQLHVWSFRDRYSLVFDL